jgi:hypothetical protein
MYAANRGIKAVSCTGIVVVAVFRLSGADATAADIIYCAGIAVIASDGVGRVYAASALIAGVIGAWIAVVAA